MKPSLAVLGLLCAAGCSLNGKAPKPMHSVEHAFLGPEKAKGVVVLLPGYGDSPADFEKRGFVDKLRARAPDFDVVAADARFAYYREGSVVEALDTSVIGPLRRKGYREIWLLGASMGGHGAIAYARSHPERIQGLLLFSPYMGPGDAIKQVALSGGLCAWTAPASFEKSEQGFALANFAWLKGQACGGGQPVSLWLGVGFSDRLFQADQLLGETLEPARFLILPGGHGWAVWTPALDTLLNRSRGLSR